MNCQTQMTSAQGVGEVEVRTTMVLIVVEAEGRNNCYCHRVGKEAGVGGHSSGVVVRVGEEEHHNLAAEDVDIVIDILSIADFAAAAVAVVVKSGIAGEVRIGVEVGVGVGIGARMEDEVAEVGAEAVGEEIEVAVVEVVEYTDMSSEADWAEAEVVCSATRESVGGGVKVRRVSSIQLEQNPDPILLVVVGVWEEAKKMQRHSDASRSRILQLVLHVRSLV